MRLTIFILGLLPFVHAASYMTNMLNALIPAACQGSCSNWTASAGSCVGGTGDLTITLDPNTGSTQFQGNKIGLYFCLCSGEAVAQGGACFSCFSQHYCLQPALDATTYSNMCTGNESPSQIFGNVHATC